MLYFDRLTSINFIKVVFVMQNFSRMILRTPTTQKGDRSPDPHLISTTVLFDKRPLDAKNQPFAFEVILHILPCIIHLKINHTSISLIEAPSCNTV